MRVDTGATLSIMSEKTNKRLWPTKILTPLNKCSNAALKTYTGKQITVSGSIDVKVMNKKQKKQLSLLVVSGDGQQLSSLVQYSQCMVYPKC